MAESFDSLRPQFPVLSRQIGGKPLLYLDSAATGQMPLSVIAVMEEFEKNHRSNVHRGMHLLAEEATDAYEDARRRVQRFLNAAHEDEIIFTKSTTESVNLVARGMDGEIRKGDVIALTILEHHSNIVPWQQLCARTGATITWIDIDNDGTLKEDSLQAALASPSLKFVAVTGMSNVLGVRPDLKKIIAMAHEKGAKVLIDAAQLVAHDQIDVQDLDCDFLAFSGHKLYGPTGIGVLYGKREALAALPPFLGGGSMIEEVTTEGFSPADAPLKFEAGTPPITQAIGLAAAIDWIGQWPLEERRKHEHDLFAEALRLLQTVPDVKILGPKNGNAEAIISFVIPGVHPHDLTSLLSQDGICLRAGHHCTQPLHRRLGIDASSRLSLSLFNTKEELQRLPGALQQAIKKLK